MSYSPVIRSRSFNRRVLLARELHRSLSIFFSSPVGGTGVGYFPSPAGKALLTSSS